MYVFSSQDIFTAYQFSVRIWLKVEVYVITPNPNPRHPVYCSGPIRRCCLQFGLKKIKFKFFVCGFVGMCQILLRYINRIASALYVFLDWEVELFFVVEPWKMWQWFIAGEKTIIFFGDAHEARHFWMEEVSIIEHYYSSLSGGHGSSIQSIKHMQII